MAERINNLVIVSDLHCGCRLGLCPPGDIPLDDGGTYKQSKLQAKVWKWWIEFWTKWLPEASRHEPYAVVVNGDSLDGVHHNSTTQISHSLKDQAGIAASILSPVAAQCKGRFYMTRGTEAHVGPSAVEDERLAEKLAAVPDEQGRHARYELWFKLGSGLIHVMHTIGTSGSMHYESTAVMKELVDEYVEAGKNRLQPPDVTVRSHRHRLLEVRVPTRLGYGISFTTPSWQLKTPYTYRLAGARVSTPQIGGSLIRQGDEDLYTRHRTWHIERTKAVTL